MSALLTIPLLQFFQAAAPHIAQPLPPPVIEPAVDLWRVLGWGMLNPATIAVAWALGRKADQTAKLGIAAFAGAVAGIALLWLAARLRLTIAVDTARAAGGVFVTSLPFALLWSWLGRSMAAR